MSFEKILQNLMNERNLSNYKLAKMVGCSQSTVKYWLDGSSIPQNRTISTVADVLGVSPAYLRGEEDLYGLTPNDWKAIGLSYGGYRLSVGASIEYVSESTGVPVDDIESFENDGYPLPKESLIAMCGVLRGATMDDVFHGFAAHFDTKKAPTVSDGREALSAEGHHIGVLFDKADEKDKLLTHSVLDKYDELGTITTIPTKSRNPGGLTEIDVYDEPAAAGVGNYLDSPQKHREQFPAVIVPKGTDFGVRISGDSMSPLIEDGVTVFIKQTMRVEPKCIGIFILNGEAYCKQLIVDNKNKQVRLHSLNPDYEDIIVTAADNLVTIGQVL